MIQVHRDLAQLPTFTNAVITIGTFDGVHLGHQKIIQQLATEARQINGETVIITFHPHPRKIVSETTSFFILNTLDEKIALLNAHGVDHVVVIPFTAAFAEQSAEAYVEEFLVRKFNPATIIIGYDHRFGKNRSGDYHLLEDLGEKFGYKVKEIPEHVLNDITVSSTRVRQALLQSDIATANGYLGYAYFFEGVIVEGNKLGRTIGYPTANVQVQEGEKLIPGNGVYAVTATLATEDIAGKIMEKGALKGMMNIGVRPTVDGTKRVIEVNLFDFEQDVYGQTLRVYLHHYVRGEQKFNGLDALKQQLAADKVAVTALLEKRV
jgi:riboflavin kinase/FMN adenylyltransferase